MGPNKEFLQLLEAGDVNALVAAWAGVFPHLPKPPDRGAAEVVMHHARTQTNALPLKARAYSHSWLGERGLPSGLPDTLRAAAERLYPRSQLAVGISVGFSSPYLRPAADAIRGVMEDAVLEANADGKLSDTDHVTARMAEARAREEKALFGRVQGVPHVRSTG